MIEAGEAGIQVCLSYHVEATRVCVCVLYLVYVLMFYLRTFVKQDVVSPEKEVQKTEGSGVVVGAVKEEAVDSGQAEAAAAGDDNEAVPEKLQDDDQILDPLYKRVFFKIFPQLRRGVLL